MKKAVAEAKQKMVELQVQVQCTCDLFLVIKIILSSFLTKISQIMWISHEVCDNEGVPS